MNIAMSRQREAKVLAEEILHSFEASSSTISEILMKTLRLARLLDDSDAERWLNFEMRGYPDKFVFSRLGVCKRYFEEGRVDPETKKYLVYSLPKIEAICQTCNTKALISKGYPIPTIKGSNTVYVEQKASFEVIKSSVYRYVVDVHISLSVGEFAEDIFNSARELVDIFLRENCPEASKQLVSIQERMKESDPESYAQALISCRRIMRNVADAVFPPQSKKYKGKNGNERKVGKEEYNNRLLAYIEENIQSDTTLCTLQEELNHLAARLDSVYKKTNKGVHDEVTRDEAELTIIHMYLFLAEIARINQKHIK